MKSFKPGNAKFQYALDGVYVGGEQTGKGERQKRGKNNDWLGGTILMHVCFVAKAPVENPSEQAGLLPLLRATRASSTPQGFTFYCWAQLSGNMSWFVFTGWVV